MHSWRVRTRTHTWRVRQQQLLTAAAAGLEQELWRRASSCAPRAAARWRPQTANAQPCVVSACARSQSDVFFCCVWGGCCGPTKRIHTHTHFTPRAAAACGRVTAHTLVCQWLCGGVPASEKKRKEGACSCQRQQRSSDESVTRMCKECLNVRRVTQCAGMCEAEGGCCGVGRRWRLLAGWLADALAGVGGRGGEHARARICHLHSVRGRALRRALLSVVF
jgi:hypothetical protein